MLPRWNNSPRIDMSSRLGTLSWFHVCSYMLSGKTSNTNFIVFFDLTRQWLQPTINRTRDEHAIYYTTDAVDIIINEH
jgi:hypothetical protein